MERKMPRRLVQHLPEHHFPAKKAMATAVAASYRTLLNTYAGQSGKDGVV